MNELNGRRILVLEEQASIAQFLADTLQALNCHVIGPADRVPQALALLAENDVEAAILDVKIEGEPSFAIAEDLIRRGIPWAFASSNNVDEVMRRYPGVPVFTKPYSAALIQRVLEQLLTPGSA